MDDVIRCMNSVSVGLAPLLVERGGFVLGKSFGKVLAYLAAGVPVVSSDAVDHPLFFKNGVNGFVLPNEVETWSAMVTSLLAGPQKRDAIANQAWTDLDQQLSSHAAAKRVVRLLDLIAGQ